MISVSERFPHTVIYQGPLDADRLTLLPWQLIITSLTWLRTSPGTSTIVFVLSDIWWGLHHWSSCLLWWSCFLIFKMDFSLLNWNSKEFLYICNSTPDVHPPGRASNITDQNDHCKSSNKNMRLRNTRERAEASADQNRVKQMLLFYYRVERG